MASSKRVLAFVIVAVLAAGLFFLRGCRPPLDPTTGTSPAVDPPAAPAPTPEQSARKGQIYFHRNLGLAKILPGAGVVTQLPDAFEDDRRDYQVQSDRLSPDATRIAFGRAATRKINGGFSAFPPDRVFVRDIATSAPARLALHLPQGTEIHNFLWSPDGKK
jgi:hypothetical protein